MDNPEWQEHLRRLREDPDYRADLLLINAASMVDSLRKMQSEGVMPPQYGTSIPDTMLALIGEIHRLREKQYG